MKTTRWFLVALVGLATTVLAEEDKKKEEKKPEFPPWSKIGKEMQGEEGFWNVYQDKKKRNFWVEIPSARLDKPFLLATSITGGTTLAGHQWNDWFLVWQRHDKKLVLLERNVGYRAEGTKEMQEAVRRTYTDRVLATYTIKTMGPKGGVVIDGRNFFASGATLFFGGVGRSKDASLAKFEPKPFPNNTEISVTMPSAGRGNLVTLHYSISGLKKTGYKPRLADDRVGYFVTRLTDFSKKNKDENRALRYVNRWQLEKLDPSLKLSPPKEPIVFYIEKTVPYRMRRYVREGILEWNRAFEKLGFDNAIVVHQQTSTNEHKDKDPEDVRYNFFRWIYSDWPFAMGPSRVHPETGQILDADILFDDSYIRFTLQEYRLQIREIPTAVTGVRGRELLARAPFKRLGLVPARDEFFDAIPDDAARPNLSPHQRRCFCSIGHGVRHQLSCLGLFFAAGNGEKKEGEGEEEKKPEFPEELIGEFVKDTVMHEVGHTLGLRHNFKASIYRTYDEIHSEEKPADISGSVMEYSPLAIAPAGRPQGHYSTTTLGPWDYWAIEYGYTAKEKDLPKVLERVAEKGLDYATDEDTWSYDPYVNTWDMGADPLRYARERVALMKRLRPELEARAVEKGEGYNRLRKAVDMQFYEANSASYLAERFVGGEHLHRDHRGDPNARAPLVPVDAAKQREAVDFLCEEFLSGRYFDFGPEMLRKLAPDFWGEDFFALFFEGHGYPYEDNVLSVQFGVMYGLLSPDRLNRVLDARHKVPAGQDVLTVPDIFDAVQDTVFGGLSDAVSRGSTNQAPALTAMQRNLQREYVTLLVFILLEGEGWYPPTVQTLARHYVQKLLRILPGPQGATGEMDTYTAAHLEECKVKLQRALEASYTLSR